MFHIFFTLWEEFLERDENFFLRPSREMKSRDETRLRRSRLVSSRLFSRRDRLVTGPIANVVGGVSWLFALLFREKGKWKLDRFFWNRRGGKSLFWFLIAINIYHHRHQCPSFGGRMECVCFLRYFFGHDIWNLAWRDTEWKSCSALKQREPGTIDSKALHIYPCCLILSFSSSFFVCGEAQTMELSKLLLLLLLGQFSFSILLDVEKFVTFY